MAVQCSSYSIISMTFERFYSVLRPHKAAAFNTMKRAKVSLISILILSVAMNIPHLFIGTNNGWQCVPYGKVIGKWYGELYYWTSFCVNFILPFLLLIFMNSYIIHAILKRYSLSKHKETDERLQSTSAEMQAIVTLLAVSFAFLLLTTPSYVLFLCVMLVDFTSTPFKVAQFHMFYNCAHKLYYTNHGVNFLFYVLSGSKFRSDLRRILTCGRIHDTSAERGTTSSTQLSVFSDVHGD